MTVFEGTPDGAGLRVAIVASRFNEWVTQRLADGAVATARSHGVAEDQLDLVWVPGAFELALAAQRLARSGRYDAIVCVGAVVRGETPHFEFVSAEAARAIGAVARECDLPVAFGVITADTMRQARARATTGDANKGREAMLAALELASVLRQVAQS